MYPDMVCIPPASAKETSAIRFSSGEGQGRVLFWWCIFSREVRDRKEWIRVEDVAVEKPLQQIPRHN